MKKLSILCLCSIAFIYAIAQKSILQTDAQKMNLKGKIKSIREMHFTDTLKKDQIIQGKGSSDENYFSEFDKNGNFTEIIYYKRNGSIRNSRSFVFGKPGLLLEESWYNNQKQLFEKMTYVYDKNNFCIKTTTYDSTGKTIRGYATAFDFKNESNYDEIRKDTTGNIIIFTHTVLLNPDKTVKSKTEYYSATYSKTSYSYNKSGQVILKNWESKDGKRKDELIEYDLKGNPIKNGVVSTFKTEYIYTEYIYDEKDNWTKRYEKYNSGIILRTERTIEYY